MFQKKWSIPLVFLLQARQREQPRLDDLVPHEGTVLSNPVPPVEKFPPVWNIDPSTAATPV